MHLSAARLQPACQPKPAISGLIYQDHPFYGPSAHCRAPTVPLDRSFQRFSIRRDHLFRLDLPNAWHVGGQHPTFVAYLQSQDECCLVVYGSLCWRLGHDVPPVMPKGFGLYHLPTAIIRPEQRPL